MDNVIAYKYYQADCPHFSGFFFYIVDDRNLLNELWHSEVFATTDHHNVNTIKGGDTESTLYRIEWLRFVLLVASAVSLQCVRSKVNLKKPSQMQKHNVIITEYYKKISVLIILLTLNALDIFLIMCCLITIFELKFFLNVGRMNRFC